MGRGRPGEEGRVGANGHGLRVLKLEMGKSFGVRL
jgi:hypothetical protein